jgi:hypothetical protein
MRKHDSYLDDDHDTDQLRQFVAEGKLPASAIVTGEQLLMKSGQTLAEKARELRTTTLTLRMWHLEHRGSGFDPAYAIRRAGHSNWLKNRWSEKDWVALVRAEISNGRARHIGDVLLACGITATNAQVWSGRHESFEQVLWHSGVPYPAHCWREFIAWIRHPTIADYRRRLSSHIARGIPETEAMHLAADEAVNELKHKTRQRRRIERDVLLGVGGHEELLRRYRGNARLTDAHSRRIAKQLFQVSRWVTMERALREIGEDEGSIKQTMAELMRAFRKSDEAGQAKWAKIRKAVLRRRAEADAFAKAEKVEALAVKTFFGARKAKYVKEWAKGRYGKPESKKRTSLTHKCA